MQASSPVLIAFATRYALQLLAPASILVQPAGRSQIGLEDIGEMTELILDAKTSVRNLAKGEFRVGSSLGCTRTSAEGRHFILFATVLSGKLRMATRSSSSRFVNPMHLPRPNEGVVWRQNKDTMLKTIAKVARTMRYSKKSIMRY